MNYLKTLQAQGLISDIALQKLERFSGQILEWNQRVNLTGFRSREEIEQNLLGESVLALRYIEVSSRDVLDIGSISNAAGEKYTSVGNFLRQFFENHPEGSV